MAVYEKLIIALRQSSPYPDLDVHKLLTAADSAYAARGNLSFEETAALAISFLAIDCSSFERGVVSGIVFARFIADRETSAGTDKAVRSALDRGDVAVDFRGTVQPASGDFKP